MEIASRRRTPTFGVLLVTIAALAASGCWAHYPYVAVGTAFDVLPHGFVTVMVGTTPYYYHRGLFYRPRGPRWVVVRAPVGAFVHHVPDGAVARRIGGVEYKEYGGVLYRPAVRRGSRGWEVARPRGRR